MRFWIMHIAVLCNQRTNIRKWWVLIIILLFSDKWNYCNLFNVGSWQSTMNAILRIHFQSFMNSIGKNVSCSSIMMTLLTFIKICRLIIWYMLWSMITIAGTGCFTRMPTPFFIIFNTVVWLMLSKYSQKNKKTEKQFINVWDIFQFAYYWPDCGKTMSLPTGLLNAGLVPKNWFYSDSTGDI